MSLKQAIKQLEKEINNNKGKSKNREFNLGYLNGLIYCLIELKKIDNLSKFE